MTFVWLKYFSSAMYFYNFFALHSIVQGLVGKEVKNGFHLFAFLFQLLRALCKINPEHVM